MNVNVKYYVRKIEYVENKNAKGEIKIKKVYYDWLHNGEKLEWTLDELKAKFAERLDSILNWEDKEFELEFECDELDIAMNQIDKIKKGDFETEKTINIFAIGDIKIGKRVSYSPITKIPYRNKFFFIEWKGIISECGGINLDGIKREFKDRVRRFYEYDNPYRHQVKEDLIIEDFVEKVREMNTEY